MLDFSDLPVVDAHCHPYSRKDKLTADQWVDAVSFGGGSAEYLHDGGIAADDAALATLQRVKRDTLYFRYMLRRLAEYFRWTRQWMRWLKRAITPLPTPDTRPMRAACIKPARSRR